MYQTNQYLNKLTYQLLIILLMIMGSVLHVSAQKKPDSSLQKHRYSKDVAVIQEYDKIYKPASNPILFVGSSSIRKWVSLQRDFGNYGVINRGVGGFVLNDLIFYADQLILKYKPRQIILYIGENDLPKATVTADSVLQRFVRLHTLIRSKLPNIPIGYIALKPSPSRTKYLAKAIAANKLIKQYLEHKPNNKFIDIFTPMTKNGQIRPELFVDDMLHMNPKGYKIWESQVRPYLELP